MERKHPEAVCEECPLAAKPCAYTQNVESDTAFVSRSPGFHEAASGKPFQGPSGQVLDFLLKKNGVERKDVMVTNVVLCAPDAGKVPPEAIKACAPRLRSELAGKKLILAGGSEAVNLILGRGSIDRHRGKRITRDDGSIVVATNNPALVLRDDSTFPNLVRDFRRAFHPLPPPILPRVEIIESKADAIAMVRRLQDAPGIHAADIESRGGLTHKARVVCMQISTTGKGAYVFGEREGLWEDEEFIATLRTYFASTNHRFLWHNGIFDTKILRYGYEIPARIDEDSLLQSYALDERGGVHGLEYLLMEEFGWPDYEPESVKKFKKTGIVDDYEELYTYAGWDAAGTKQLHDFYAPKIIEDEQERVYRKILIPGANTIVKMALAGFPYDVNAAGDEMENVVGPEMKQLIRDMQKEVDNPLLNPRSTKAIPILYYDTWGISHEMQKRPDKKRSCDEAALQEIVDGRYATKADYLANYTQDDIAQLKKQIHDFTELLMRYRELDKQAGTYIIGMMKRAMEDPDGKIYTDLLLHGTTSGRWASRSPNLQNITRTKDGLPDIRKFFKASPGRLIVQADYSQAELRCIAELSGDPTLIGVYRDGRDLHDLTATRFYGEGFKKEQRSTSKNVNFGMFYRQSAKTFQEKHGIPEAEAARYIAWAKTEFKRVWEWETELEKEIKGTGRLVSPFGRKRRFHLLTPENLQAVFREGINFLPQTTAADCTTTSCIKLAQEIDWKRASIVLTVHDSILGDVDEDYVEEYSSLCVEIMESRPKEEIGWTLPFVADIKFGPTWGDC